MASQEQLNTKRDRTFVAMGRLWTCRASSQVRILDASTGRREWTGMDVPWTQLRNRMSGNGRAQWTAMDAEHGRAPLSKGVHPSRDEQPDFNHGAQADTAQNHSKGPIASE